MGKCLYQDILNGDYKVLGYYIDQFFAATQDRDAFDVVAVRIMPLIRQSPIFRKFYSQYVFGKNEYFKIKNELEYHAPLEIEQAFTSLQKDLELAGLLNNLAIKSHIDLLAEIFVNKDRHGIPTYFEEAYHQEVCLLEKLLEVGAIDIVNKYAVISYDNVVRQNVTTGVCENTQQPYIEKTFFALSLLKLRELNDETWNLKRKTPFWVAWERLYLIEWCWFTPFTFFNENYETSRLGNQTIQLLSLHSDWCEINAIKSATMHSSCVSFFNKTQIAKFLQVIIDEIIMDQALSDAYNKRDDVIQNEVLVFHSIELILPYDKLYLDVKWSRDGIVIRYLIHKFHDGLGPCEFMRDLLKNKTMVVKKGSIAKYITAAQLNNDLGDAIITRVNTLTATMSDMPIGRDFFSDKQARELSAFIQQQITKGEFKEIPNS